jgi:hypothetical protein
MQSGLLGASGFFLALFCWRGLALLVAEHRLEWTDSKSRALLASGCDRDWTECHGDLLAAVDAKLPPNPRKDVTCPRVPAIL